MVFGEVEDEKVVVVVVVVEVMMEEIEETPICQKPVCHSINMSQIPM